MEQNLEEYNLIFIPGGPWISGLYWDDYILSLPHQITCHRYILLNHETRYSIKTKITRAEIEADLKDYIQSKIDKRKKNILIAHSYGAWLSLASFQSNLEKGISKLICVCMPFSTNPPARFQEKLERLNTPYHDNSSFTEFFKRISSLYFEKPFDAAFNIFFENSYMTGNEKLIYNEENLEPLINNSIADPRISFIFGENDQLAGKPWEIFSFKNFSLIHSAHFPMIENRESFTKILLSHLLQ